MSLYDEVWDDFDQMSLKEQLDAVDEEREVDWLVAYNTYLMHRSGDLFLYPKEWLPQHPRTLAWIDREVEARRDLAERGDPDAAYEGSKDA